MNIVDVIKSQLGGDVAGRLSSLVGESEDKVRTAATAAVPGLLAVLANLASTSGGAEKVINALRQVDTGAPGDIGDVLAGPRSQEVEEQGGSLLNILLGSGTLSTLLSLLSKFASIAPGTAKKLLSMLAPLILSIIAKQLSGRTLTAQSLSSFFAEQKANITAALPAGLSLADIPGLSGAAAAAPRAAMPAAEESGLPGWLLPLVGLGVLGALAWWFLGKEPAVEPKVENEPRAAAPVPKPVPKVEPPAVPKADTALPDVTKFGTDLAGAYTAITDALAGVKDAPSADAALPKLTDWTAKLDGYKAIWDKLNDAGKAAITKITAEHLDKLKGLVATVMKVPGLSDKFKDVVNGLVTRLAALTTR